MGSIWGHKWPDYFEEWGLRFRLADGWRTRARSTGGFDAVMGIRIHHDAGPEGWTWDRAFNWSCLNSPSKPVGNMSLGRDGVFTLWAAGAANTQGRGGPEHTSRGVLALDTGNTRLVGIEANNNGIGQAWTDEQCEAYPVGCAALLDWATKETPGAPLGPGDVRAHFEYAEGRKFDPAGPSLWAPAGIDPATGLAHMWDMDAFRGDVFKAIVAHNKPTVPPPPAPTPQEGDMRDLELVKAVDDDTIYLGNGVTRRVVANLDELNTIRFVFADRLRNGGNVGSVAPEQLPAWGVLVEGA